MRNRQINISLDGIDIKIDEPLIALGIGTRDGCFGIISTEISSTESASDNQILLRSNNLHSIVAESITNTTETFTI